MEKLLKVSEYKIIMILNKQIMKKIVKLREKLQNLTKNILNNMKM